MQRLGGLLAVLLLGACVKRAAVSAPPSCTEGLKEVRVELLDQQLVDASFKHARFDTLWRVRNPYRGAVTLSDWAQELTVDHRLVPGPATSPSVEVAGGECKIVTVSLDIDFTRLPIRFGGREYAVSVAPVVKTPHGEERPQGEHTGTVVLPQPPEASLAGMKVARTAEAATLSITVQIDNSNGFAVAFDGLDAELFISADRIGRLRAPSGPPLQPREHRKLEFELRADFMSIGAMSRAALKSTEAMSFDVKGKLLIEGLELPISRGGMTYAR